MGSYKFKDTFLKDKVLANADLLFEPKIILNSGDWLACHQERG
jgi:hypothetical protein